MASSVAFASSSQTSHSSSSDMSFGFTRMSAKTSMVVPSLPISPSSTPKPLRIKRPDRRSAYEAGQEKPLEVSVVLRYARSEKGGKKSYGAQDPTNGKEEEDSARGPRQYEARPDGMGRRQQRAPGSARTVRHGIDR